MSSFLSPESSDDLKSKAKRALKVRHTPWNDLLPLKSYSFTDSVCVPHAVAVAAHMAFGATAHVKGAAAGPGLRTSDAISVARTFMSY